MYLRNGGYETKTLSINADFTEVIVLMSSSYDSTSVRVTSYSNMTQIVYKRINGHNSSAYLYVFKKNKGETASLTAYWESAYVIAR